VNSAPSFVSSGWRTFPRLLVAIATFALVGPPVGGLVAWVMMGTAGAHSPGPFISGSYAEGMVLALGTGVIFAVAAWFGRTSWLVAVGAAVLANAAMHIAMLDFANPQPGVALMNVAYVFLPPSIVAAVACWWLTRRLVTR
jgi:hypothetical protein